MYILVFVLSLLIQWYKNVICEANGSLFRWSQPQKCFSLEGPMIVLFHTSYIINIINRSFLVKTLNNL